MASLSVMCKMARLVDNEETYQHYRDILDRGSAAFDKLLWNGKCKHPSVAFSMCIRKGSPLLETLFSILHFMFRQVLQL